MIATTTYVTTQCDACNKNFGKGMETLEKQFEALGKSGWRLSEGRKLAVCPECVHRAKIVCDVCGDPREPQS